MSTPGREATTARMLTDLHRQNPSASRVWLYSSTVKPSVEPFYEMLAAHGGEDVLFLEDDIVTARNFVAYAMAWTSPYVTSFFNVARTTTRVAVPAIGFSFSQAVKLPAAVVRKILDWGWLTRRRIVAGVGHDDEIGRALSALGELVVYHRSLVQHVGERSMCWGPERTLMHRTANDFVGEEFDCLSLLNARTPEVTR